MAGTVVAFDVAGGRASPGFKCRHLQHTAAAGGRVFVQSLSGDSGLVEMCGEGGKPYEATCVALTQAGFTLLSLFCYIVHAPKKMA